MDKKENKKDSVANWIQQYIKTHHDWGLPKEYKASSTLKKQCNSPYLLIKEEKIYDHISWDKKYLKPTVTYNFLKNYQKLEIEENFLNLKNNVYKNTPVNIILDGERLKAFPFWLGIRQGDPCITFIHYTESIVFMHST